METNTHIQMKFVCNKEWEEMTLSANGRFCDKCKHEVFDFSNMTNEQIAIKQKEGAACGKFRIEQTEDLTLIEFKTFKKARYWFATITAFLGLELSKAHAQRNRPEVRCEITGHCPEVSKDTPQIIPSREMDAEEEVPESIDPKILPEKSRYYFSKRFPFIKKRRRYYTMGAYSFVFISFAFLHL